MGKSLSKEEFTEDGSSPSTWIIDKLPFVWTDSVAMKKKKDSDFMAERKVEVGVRMATTPTTLSVSQTPTDVMVYAALDSKPIDTREAKAISDRPDGWDAQVKNTKQVVRSFNCKSACTRFALLKKTGITPAKRIGRVFQAYLVVTSEFNAIFRPLALLSEEHVEATQSSMFRRIFRLHTYTDAVDDTRLAITETLTSSVVGSTSGMETADTPVSTVLELVTLYEPMQTNNSAVFYSLATLIDGFYKLVTTDPKDFQNLQNDTWKVGGARLLAVTP